MARAVYAGSFDPITNGHRWMIETGATLFDELIVAIGVNPDKGPSFTLDERLDLLARSIDHVPNVRVDSFENQYLAHYAAHQEAAFILRGIRTPNDFSYEHMIRNINEDIRPGIETVILTPPRELAEISSSLVRGLVGPDGWEDIVAQYVPRPVFKAFLERNDGHYHDWQRLWEAAGAKGDPRPAYETRVAQYSDASRHYHDLVHVSEMLRAFRPVASRTNHPLALLMALWDHDVIYDPNASDNEEQSAAFLRREWSVANVYDHFIDEAEKNVLATKHATPAEGLDWDERVMVDLDLAILGSDPRTFDEYDRAIRQEYAWVPDHIYDAERAKILHGFNARQIFLTPDFAHLEQRAHENLSSVLDAR